MRGPGSRLAALVLALAFGAAGAHSLGSSSPTGAARSVDAASALGAKAPHVAVAGLTGAATGGGWERAETERTGSGAGADRSRRIAREAAPRSSLAPASGALPSELPARWSGGLLGLAASPANAPPGS